MQQIAGRCQFAGGLAMISRGIRVFRISCTLGVGLVLVTPLGHAAATCQLIKYAELPVTMTETTPLIKGSINGVPAVFVADSGAFFSMVTSPSAAKFGLRVSGYMPIEGVGGGTMAGVALAKEFTLEGFGTQPIPRVQFLIAGSPGSTLIDGWIGQNVLGIDDTEYDLGNGVIRLFHARGCGNEVLAYWRGTADVSMVPTAHFSLNRHILGEASLNGAKIRVLFDSGSSHSMLTLEAAARAGIKPDSPGVVAAGSTGGIGRASIRTWIARFDDLNLGGEQIMNARLRIGAIALPDADFLLGADFFLSHRILFAKSQGKVYFTFNGGHVFDLKIIPGGDTASTPDPTVAQNSVNTPDSAGEPVDAPGFRRRGAAFAGRGEMAKALADLDHAVQLDPTDPENFYQRALAHLREKHTEPAMADLDQAIKLNPEFVDALMARASLRLESHDEPAATADYDVAVRAAPGDPALGLRVAGSYVAAGQYAGAIHFFDWWIDAYPGDNRRAAVLNNRCWARAMLNQRLDLAMADCDASLKLQFDPATLDTRALVWLQMGDWVHSVADYKFSLARRPNSAWSLYGKGLAELRLGQKAMGEKDMSAALKIAPDIADKFKKIGLNP